MSQNTALFPLLRMTYCGQEKINFALPDLHPPQC
ncbi:tail fiber protein [uncultured Erythrobacter sp.]|nr:tail fiber protein [uncultured Erythrobacter sp.]